MATYTVQGGQSWLGLSMQLYGDYEHAKYLRKLNRGTTLSQGVVIRTGGAVAGERAPDINPWGLGAGQVPEYAAGTDIALDYLAAIGQPTGAVTEVPGVTPAGEGVTPAGERPPAELAPQALMVGPEQLTTPELAPSLAPGLGEQQELEALALTGAAGVPVTPESITMAELTGADIGPQPPIGAAPVSPEAQLGLGPGAYPGVRPIGGGAPQPERAPEALPEEGAFVTPELPPAAYPYGTTSAANYTARAMSDEYDADGNLIREGQLAGAISPDVADMLGMSNEMLVLSGYVWDATSGLWHLQPQDGGTGDTTTGGGGGRGRRRGRRGYGGGQSPYGSSFKSNVGGLINWRRGFGG